MLVIEKCASRSQSGRTAPPNRGGSSPQRFRGHHCYWTCKQGWGTAPWLDTRACWIRMETMQTQIGRVCIRLFMWNWMGKDTIPTDIGHYFHHKKSKPLLDGCFQLHIPPGRNMQVTVVFKSYGFTRHSASVQYHGLGTLRYKTLNVRIWPRGISSARRNSFSSSNLGNAMYRLIRVSDLILIGNTQDFLRAKLFGMISSRSVELLQKGCRQVCSSTLPAKGWSEVR